jgi:hypothetical protein
VFGESVAVLLDAAVVEVEELEGTVPGGGLRPALGVLVVADHCPHLVHTDRRPVGGDSAGVGGVVVVHA